MKNIDFTDFFNVFLSGATIGVLSFLVDPRRIELLSEKRSAGLSPSAFRLLKFPPHSADRQALCFGSFLMRDGVKS